MHFIPNLYPEPVFHEFFLVREIIGTWLNYQNTQQKICSPIRKNKLRNSYISIPTKPAPDLLYPKPVWATKSAKLLTLNFIITTPKELIISANTVFYTFFIPRTSVQRKSFQSAKLLEINLLLQHTTK